MISSKTLPIPKECQTTQGKKVTKLTCKKCSTIFLPCKKAKIMDNFKYRAHLQYHIEMENAGKELLISAETWPCIICDQIFANYFDMVKHAERTHPKFEYKCRECDKLRFKKLFQKNWPSSGHKNRSFKSHPWKKINLFYQNNERESKKNCTISLNLIYDEGHFFIFSLIFFLFRMVFRIFFHKRPL